MRTTEWVEDGPREYQCELELVVFPDGDGISLPITLNGEGVSVEQYAEICQHLQNKAQNALTEALHEISVLLDQGIGIGHYATGGICQKDWKALSQTIAIESNEHVEHFFTLKLEAAISEGMSWAVLRFDVMPSYSDVTGSWLRDHLGLEEIKRTRSQRRRARLDSAIDYGSTVARVVRELLLPWLGS